MGFFSWNCPGCGESIKAPYACEHTRWQNECTALLKGGGTISGSYDGYGRIEGMRDPDSDFDFDDMRLSDNIELWHTACWEKAGKPKRTGPSKGAQDQGYFYECPECAAYVAKYPHRMSTVHMGHELKCKRTERALLMKQHPDWADSLEGPVDARWYCEEEDCPHHGAGDTCNYAGDSEEPLHDEDYNPGNIE